MRSERRVWRKNCDVGKATEGLENELWRMWSDGKVGEWALPTSKFILQPFFRFSYVTGSSPGEPPMLLSQFGKGNLYTQKLRRRPRGASAAVRCLPPTAAGVPPLSHSMWVLWWTKRRLDRFFWVFPVFSYHKFITFLLIHLIHFTFISPCDRATGVIARTLSIHWSSIKRFRRISSLDPALCRTRVEDVMYIIISSIEKGKMVPIIPKMFYSFIQSHLYIRPSNRRLSLAALPGLPVASRGLKLTLLADTRSVFSHCNTGNFVNTRVDKNTPRS